MIKESDDGHDNGIRHKRVMETKIVDHHCRYACRHARLVMIYSFAPRKGKPWEMRIVHADMSRSCIPCFHAPALRTRLSSLLPPTSRSLLVHQNQHTKNERGWSREAIAHLPNAYNWEIDKLGRRMATSVLETLGPLSPALGPGFRTCFSRAHPKLAQK
jgi:hypothetical protein